MPLTAIKTTSVPQAKGRVERVFGTLHARLIAEFDLNNITSIEETNEFLKPYIKKFNQQFSFPLHHITYVFEKAPYSANLNIILGVLNHRKINSEHHFQFQNNYFLPVTSSGKEKYFNKGMKDNQKTLIYHLNHHL